jgi:integrase
MEAAMSRKSIRPPAYLFHKPSGQARVRISGKDHYLGPHGSPESKDRYDDLIAAWRLQSVPDDRHAITIDDLALAYMEHAKGHYVKNGKPTSEVCCLRSALRFLIAAAGRTRARDFGPKLLKAVRQNMIEGGLSRKTINKNVERLRRMYRWGVAEELISASVLVALAAVPGLRAGRSQANEGRTITAVSQAAIDAIKPYVSPIVWRAVQVQLLSGMRSGEVLSMRGCDLNMAGAIWEYRPESHKTEHHGRSRIVFLGPKAQAVIRECLAPSVQARLFEPYTRDSYRREITRACERAFDMPVELRRPERGLSQLPDNQRSIEHKRRMREASAWHAEHCWFPHQLRHTAATLIRREAGIEVAKAVLGHSDLDVTAMYAEADEARARDIMAKV